jgi:hypothetical protein
MTHTGVATHASAEGPSGLGGWLVLPIIGLFLAPVQQIISVLDTGYLGILRSARTLSHPQAALLYAELLASIVLNFIAPAFLLFFLFKRWDMFPGWFVVWAASVLVYALADPLAAHLVFPESFPNAADAFDEDTVKGISRAAWGAIIWIPYMLNSKRVRNTFTR